MLVVQAHRENCAKIETHCNSVQDQPFSVVECNVHCDKSIDYSTSISFSSALELTIPFLPLDAIAVHLEADSLRLSDIERFKIISDLEVGVLLLNQIGQEVYASTPLGYCKPGYTSFRTALTVLLQRWLDPLPPTQSLTICLIESSNIRWDSGTSAQFV
jgi:hypothetical protein